MDNFYVTLPSNSSVDVFPDNKKSNFTTHLNTPINLNGNYEVALASITCTRNIKNDYGELVVKKSGENYPFLLDINPDLHLELTDAFNLQDKINNDSKEIFSLFQILYNSYIIYRGRFHHGMCKQRTIFVFYDIQNTSDSILIFSDDIHVQSSQKIPENKLRKVPVGFLDEYKLKNYSIEYYPYIDEWIKRYFSNENEYGIFTIDDLIINFKKKQINPQLKLENKYEMMFSEFNDVIEKINERDDTGLIIITACVSNDKIKLHCNRNIRIEALGVCKDLIFKDSFIKLDKFYHMPGKLDFIKYGIIYCDIIQEQIFGGDYLQVLQIITLDNTENSAILINNLDNMQYVPVKKNFISTINISIKSLVDEYIKFADDFIYTIVKLHFRKIV